MGRRSNGGSSSSPVADAAYHGKDVGHWRWSCDSCKRKHPVDHTWCNCGRCKSWTWISETSAGLGQIQPQQQEQCSPSWARIVAGAPPNAVGEGGSIGLKELAKDESFQGCMARLLATMESQQQAISPKSSEETGEANPKPPCRTQEASIGEAGQAGAKHPVDGNGLGNQNGDVAIGKLEKLLVATIEVYGQDSIEARGMEAQLVKAKALHGGPGKSPKSLEQQMVAQLHKLQNAQKKKSKQEEKLQSAREAATKAIAALHEAEQRSADLEQKVAVEQQAHEELAKKAVPGTYGGAGDFSSLLGISSPVPALLAPKLRQLHEFVNELKSAIASANAADPAAAAQSHTEPRQTAEVGKVGERQAEDEHDDPEEDEDEDMPSGDEEEGQEIFGGEDAIAALLRPHAKRRKGHQGSSVESAAAEATLG